MAIDGGFHRRDAIAALGGGLCGAALPSIARAAPASRNVGYLRTEWRVDPVGIDTLRPRFTWEFDGEADEARVIVAASRAAALAGHGDVWDSGWRRVERPSLAPDQPLALEPHRRYWWAVATRSGSGAATWSASATFATGMAQDAPWPAQWLAARPDPVDTPHVRGWSKRIAPDDAAMPIFRREFMAREKPVRAIVSVAGLGQYVLRINGRPVTDTLFNPGWTDYRKTVLTNSYDVTDLIGAGANALGVLLGNGFFNVEKRAGRYTKLVESFGAPEFILVMTLLHHDGSVERVASDSSWRVVEGPVRWSSIYSGEDVDARLEPAGWDKPGFDAAGWRQPLVATAPGGKLRAQGAVPVAVDREITAVARRAPKPGVVVHDFGINFSGVPRLVVRGPAGSRVRLIPSESLGPDGQVSQRSYGVRKGYEIWFDYTLSGRGDEVFVPMFTYQGFRYLQVERVAAEGGRELPAIVSLTGQFVFAAMPKAGDFDCGTPLLTRIHKLIRQAVLSNAVSVLTDCPHREKLGWLEQTHLNAATVFYNREAVTLYEKLTRDVADAQAPDGMVPGHAPEYTQFLEADGSDAIWRNSPEWGAAAILSPWAAYRRYGDRRLIEQAYPVACRYADYLESRAAEGIVDFGMGDWDDLGPGKRGPSQLTSRALTGTATWYQSLVALAGWAKLLGKARDAARFTAEAKQIAAAFNARFFDAAKGSYDTGSQTANAMPLALGLVPAGRERDVLAALVADVRANGNGVTAGDVGFHYVVEALSRYDRDDVMLDMLLVTDRPGYGYQLAHGATALAESWEADPSGSLNHFMMGHAEGWLFGRLGGITIDFLRPADRIVTIAPKPVGAVPWAQVTARSPFGEVESRWTRRGGALALDVTVPMGTRATVRVPTSAAARVRVGGAAVAGAPGVHTATPVAGGLDLVVAPGRYRFVAPV
ncbi:MAG TPA: family 78 glycoside hydrolase catalytic domain [Sphingomonas sp.]|nr:family 78 glycoside hydrolase catalytic domain [Sphingomonas sp.]